jgi:hypothetical protein
VAERDPWSWTELWKEYRDGPKTRGVEFDDFLYERMLKLRQINSELLEACKEIVRMLGDDCNRYRAGEKALAAIAKAAAEE